MSAVTHNVSETLLDGFWHGLHRFEFCVNHSPVPVVEKSGRRSSSVLTPKITEHFLGRPCLSGLELTSVCRIEESLPLLRDILVARHPDVLRFAQRIIAVGHRLAMLVHDVLCPQPSSPSASLEIDRAQSCFPPE